MSALVILVVTPDAEVGNALAADVEEMLGGLARVDRVNDATQAISRGSDVDAAGGLVPVVFAELDLSGTPDVAPLMRMHREPALAPARLILVSSGTSLHGVDEALQAGAINGMLTRPWTETGLRNQLEASLATALIEHAPDELARFEGILDEEDRQRARARLAQRRDTAAVTPSTPHHLLDAGRDEEETEAQLVEVLDEVLGHPPRLRVAPGTVMIEEGADVGGIYVILDGSVQLSSTDTTGERVLHDRSTGAIVGLLSLASHRRAMLRCTATTEVRAIPVTLDQLARALDQAPQLAGLLTWVLISSLARRLRRSDELQVELDRSLAELAAARTQLIAQARFATLGELAAGMAHELNNPAAALARSIDHLTASLESLVDDADVAAEMAGHLERPLPAPAAARASRRALTEELGDRHVAERFVALGIDSAEVAREVLAGGRLDRLEAVARTGLALRTATQATDRIVSLVDSLRSYARGEDGRGPLVDGVNVKDTLHDALRLLSHRLTDREVERLDEPTPLVAARPGALQQVWTNLISNAIEATGPGGTIRVTTGPGPLQGVRVHVIDDGTGIPQELAERIFEPRFTTRAGSVQFGLGLGLSISRQIVMDHGGHIEVSSRPGHTDFTVDLPSGGSP